MRASLKLDRWFNSARGDISYEKGFLYSWFIAGSGCYLQLFFKAFWWPTNYGNEQNLLRKYDLTITIRYLKLISKLWTFLLQLNLFTFKIAPHMIACFIDHEQSESDNKWIFWPWFWSAASEIHDRKKTAPQVIACNYRQ